MSGGSTSVISLFSGALGLDLGLERSGFSIRVAVDCNRYAAETIRKNRPDIQVFERPLEEVPTKEILAAMGAKPGSVGLVTGGPSCQAFSTAGNRQSVRDPRGGMFRQFLRVVNEAKPRFFVMENVRGILSAAVSHRPLNRRGPGFPRLQPDEELGSALRVILKALRATGYHVAFYVLNAADYGVPQIRERVVFVGSREGRPLDLPRATHAPSAADGLQPWATLHEALCDLNDPTPEFPPLSASKRKYLALIPEGGNWRDLPKRMQPSALGKAYVSWGGRSGFLRRLAWERPSPALTTRPDCRATMFCHPNELRPLSVREFARVQQFPDDWVFAGPRAQQYSQIGNAVPLGLGTAIGMMLKRAARRKARTALLGKVVCVDPVVLERLEQRPRTVLNPQRMRRVRGAEAARRWNPDAGCRSYAGLLVIPASDDMRTGVR